MTTFSEFYDSQDRFHSLTQSQQIVRTIWFLHVVLGKDRVAGADVKRLFDELHLADPHIHVHMSKLAGQKSPVLLKDKRGYYLEGKTRLSLSDQLVKPDKAPTAPSVLADLIGKIGVSSQQVFLTEALDCYNVGAYRASTVMVWNLAFDHLSNWITREPSRLVAFNQQFGQKYQKIYFEIKVAADLEEIKEHLVIQICAQSRLINTNIANMLYEKLKRRNAAAHPSSIKITKTQLDDTITDLVENIVLSLV